MLMQYGPYFMSCVLLQVFFWRLIVRLIKEAVGYSPPKAPKSVADKGYRGQPYKRQGVFYRRVKDVD